MIELNRCNRDVLTELFREQQSPKVQTYLQGYCGKGYVDDLKNPTVAVIMVSIFAIIAGNAQSESVENMLHTIPDRRLIIAPSSEWNQKIEEILTSTVTKHRQYRCSGSAKSFDIPMLKRYTETLPEGYTLRQIDKELVSGRSQDGLPSDFIENFGSEEEFAKRGVGFWILYNDVVVSGATSFFTYNGGIEIDIETDESHRGKGLATVVAAGIILWLCSL